MGHNCTGQQHFEHKRTKLYRRDAENTEENYKTLRPLRLGGVQYHLDLYSLWVITPSFGHAFSLIFNVRISGHNGFRD